MPDKNVQLPDGRIVAFPDSMADADISSVIKKQLDGSEPPPKISSSQAMAANLLTGGMAIPVTTALRGEKGTEEDISKVLGGAGLPTSLDQIPKWLEGLKNFNIQNLFVDPIKKAIDKPTAENIVATVPLFGSLSNQLSKDIDSGDIGGAALRLAGNLAALKGTGQIKPGAEAIKAQVADARDIISQVAKATKGNSLTVAALDKILPENASTDFKGGAYSDYFGESGKAVPVSKSPVPGGYRGPNSVPPPSEPTPPPAFPGASSSNMISLQPLAEQPRGYAGPLIKSPTTTTGPNIQLVNKLTPPQPSKIVLPGSEPPPINRTLVSYDGPTLVKMAKGGDIDALTELIRNPRGIDIASAIPNSRYLLEANRATNIYGGPGSQ